MAWPLVTKREPCPICGKPDWCNRSPDGAMVACRRVDTGEALKHKVDRSGGEYWLYVMAGHEAHRREPVDPAPKPSQIPAPPDTRHTVYTALLHELHLVEDHRNNLRQRGLSDDEITRRGYKSLSRNGRSEVVASLMSQFSAATLAQVPGLFLHPKRQAWSIAGANGILIPVRDHERRIVALRVRSDDPDVSRYTWVSSAKYDGPSPGAAPHVPLCDDREDEWVCLTEGELKADVVTSISGRLAISIPGVSTWRAALPILQAIGASCVELAFDADQATNHFVQQALDRAAGQLLELGYRVRILSWDLAIAKGIDDLLVAGHVPEVRELEPPPARNSDTSAFPTSNDDGFEDVPPPTDDDAPPEVRDAIEYDSLDALLERIKIDKGAAFTPEATRLLAKVQNDPVEWARARDRLKKAGVSLRDVGKQLKELLADRPVMSSKPLPQGALGGDQLRKVALGEDLIWETPDGYCREAWRHDVESGQPARTLVPFTNWTIAVRRVIRAEDDGLTYDSEIVSSGRRTPIMFGAPELADAKRLHAALIQRVPTGIMTAPGSLAQAANAVSGFNETAPEVVGCNAPGYVDPRTYVTPSVIVRNGRIEVNEEYPCMVESPLAQRYDLAIGTDEQALMASHTLLTEAIEVHRHEVTLPLLGAIVGAPLISRCGWQRYTLYLEGRFGEGKTLPCRVMLNMFADVPLKGSDRRGSGLVSAISTGNNLEMELHTLRDVPVVIDDVKMETTDVVGLFRLVQMAHDGNAKGRMTRGLRRASQFPPRGQCIMTGEEIPPNVASVISRMLVLRVRQGVQPDRLDAIEKHRKDFRILTGRYIAWTQRQPIEKLAVYHDITLELRNTRTEIFARQILASLRNFFSFLRDDFEYWREHSEFLDALMTDASMALGAVSDHTRERTAAERKEDLFIGALAAIIASGGATVGEHPTRTAPRVAIPVLVESGVDAFGMTTYDLHVDIITETAVNLVGRLRKMEFSPATLGEHLRDSGMLVKTRNERPSFQRRVAGERLTLWRIHARHVLSEREVEMHLAEILKDQRKAAHTP